MLEYKVVQTPRLPMNDTRLNELAEDGWRLIQIVVLDQYTTRGVMYWTYFEREVDTKLQKG